MLSISDKKLTAIIPEYKSEKGDCTTLHFLDEEPITVERNIRTVLKNIAKEFMLDLTLAKRKYGAVVSSPGLVPIPLGKEDVFLPLKVRKPLFKNDKAFGYINLKYIKEIKSNKDLKTDCVILSNNQEIELMCTRLTALKQMKNARVVKELYIKRSMQVAEEDVVYEDGKLVVKVVVHR